MTISDLHLECKAEETKLHNRIKELRAQVETLKAEVEKHERITGFTLAGQQGTRDAAVEIIKEKRELEAQVEALQSVMRNVVKAKKTYLRDPNSFTGSGVLVCIDALEAALEAGGE